MCILFIAINQHKDYPVIIAANRDEFHVRPTKSAHFWPGEDKMLAGLDLQAGGTWLGLNSAGNFAALTNIRNGQNSESAAKSRGELVTTALQYSTSFDVTWLNAHSDNYNPFNLIYGSNTQLLCFNSESKKQTTLADGFHAICNGALDDIWPKMTKGEHLLEQLISEQKTINPEHIFAIMKDPSQAPDELLPDTGVGIEWERLLSSIFIQSTDYGTRSTTVILKHHSGTTDFFEQSYTADGSIFNKHQFALAKS